MANRIPSPNLFAGLPPDWLLSSLDQNSGFYQTGFNDSSLGWVNGIPVDTGSANAYSVVLPFGSPSSPQDGMCVAFIPANTNTGGSALTVSPLGSAAILNKAGIALTGGEIIANKACVVVYKTAVPTGFRLLSHQGLSYQASPSGNVTVECAGYDSIYVFLTFTSVTSCALTLSHLAMGIPVAVTFNNQGGGTLTYSIKATDAAGNNYGNIYGSIIFGGGLSILQQGATVNNQTLNPVTAAAFTGVTGIFTGSFQGQLVLVT
jgi:hypothetical protein